MTTCRPSSQTRLRRSRCAPTRGATASGSSRPRAPSSATRASHAQIDDVAKRAKVGVGTVYRHFPTKEALLEALVRERFEEIAGYAERGARARDAWEGFCELIWRAAERNAIDRAFCEVVAFTDQSASSRRPGSRASTERR